MAASLTLVQGSLGTGGSPATVLETTCTLFAAVVTHHKLTVLTVCLLLAGPSCNRR